MVLTLPPHSTLHLCRFLYQPLEDTESFADGQSPSNPPSVPEDPFLFSAANSLVLPQQVEEEGRLEPHPPSGGGKADSGPQQGTPSLVHQPIEEQGRGPAQGDVLRGLGHGTHGTQQARVCVHACSNQMSTIRLY